MSKALRASAGRVLSYRAHGHHLDERVPARDYAGAGWCGVQDTPPGSGPLALAARVEGVTADTWSTARERKRSIIAGWSVRGAPFAFARTDHTYFTNGVCPTDERSWISLLGPNAKLADGAGLTPSGAVARVAAEVNRLLRAGPMTKPEVSTALRERELLPPALMPYCKGCDVHHVGEQILRVSGVLGTFCFGPSPDGSLTLVRTEDWLGAGATSGPRAVAAAELVRRFLVLYGPADAAMFSAWTGLSLADASARFTAITDELVPVVVDGDRRWLLADEVERFRSTPPTRGVRFLPPYDPFLQQRDREVLVADPSVRKQLWKAIGPPGVLLVDGKVAGWWRPAKKGTRLTLKVEVLAGAASLSARTRSTLEDEAAIVGEVRGADSTDVALA